MTVKGGVDRTDLSRLVEQQATALQGMPCHWSVDPIEEPDSFHDSTRDRFENQYLESSRALGQLLEFPQCDPVTGTSQDHPDLDPCMRIYPITRNSIFPPRMRQQAHR